MKDSPNLINSTETQAPMTIDSNRQLRWLEIAFWLIAILLGFFHTWADHHYLMNADAMSYLDIAEAYLRKDWHSAVNSYWSPLYSWLIALALFIVRPSPYWKFAVLHMVNYGIYLFAFGCFGFLMREVVRRHQSQRAELLSAGFVTLPDWALVALGYSLFVWSTLFLILIQEESPDMLVAAFVYLATGIVLRMRRQTSSWLNFLLLGIVLGFGYLAKSVMLPMALVFLVAAMFSIGSVRRALPRVAVAAAFFLLVAGPFVFAMSRAKGRFTTGESGRLNYLWSINGITNSHWQGEEPCCGVPTHTTRKILDKPPAFEFGEPVGGTYPVWYDPTYWYEGSVSHFNFRQQLRVFVEAVRSYYELFHRWGLQFGLLVGVISLYLMGNRPRQILHDLTQQWSLIVPAIAALGLYAVVNVQGRYVASFVVLLWLSLFSSVRLNPTLDSQRLIRAITIVLVAIIVVMTVASSGSEAVHTARHVVAGEDPSAHEQWQVAEGLREKGFSSTDRVAFIGPSLRAFWAHLLGVRIVAEIRRDKVAGFWEGDSRLKAELIDAFARTGVKAVVAESPPSGTDLTGWQRIRHTDYYVYMLK
jgi:4-amino-4-deoxy-L-arabinose transferase-like glycosyltransferase